MKRKRVYEKAMLLAGKYPQLRRSFLEYLRLKSQISDKNRSHLKIEYFTASSFLICVNVLHVNVNISVKFMNLFETTENPILNV